ncbi:hypothetical protein [Demequina iriomotensis]|uniref:hypothetical protein n=1 Tax=Demequina iriomotensis TaxID=1536641 RepID=UPI001E542605|nr:hypothetical protein [Demequina iriomotensis]
MAEPSVRARTVLGIADAPGDPLVALDWVGKFVALGSLLRRHLARLDDRQLVVALSVPRRDYVAALVGSGWMLSKPAPVLASPLEVFETSDRLTCLRAVTDEQIITGPFIKLEEHPSGTRVLTGGKRLPVERFRAVAPVESATVSICSETPPAGYLAELTGAAAAWLARLAAPPMDLALVGTRTWLQADLEALIGDGASAGAIGTALGTYVLPCGPDAATWSTPIISAPRLGEGEALPDSCLAAVLDRYGAIKYLNEVSVPIVVCVVDRSVASESAAETVIEARHNNSQPVSLHDELRWRPPAGVEAIAFTVAR